jgi:hypothetical protein
MSVKSVLEFALVMASPVVMLGGALFLVNATGRADRKQPADTEAASSIAGAEDATYSTSPRAGMSRRLHMYGPWIVGMIGVLIILLYRALAS